MYCQQCGTTIEADANFCGGCGLPASSVEGEAVVRRAALPVPVGGPYTNRAARTGSSFVTFARDALKGPWQASRATGENQLLEGVLTLVAIALLMPLYSYFVAREAAGGFGGFVEVPFGATVLEPFLYMLLFLAVYAGINVGVAKLMHNDVSFKNVLARYGALAIIPGCGLVLANFLQLISLNFVGALVYLVTLVAFLLASVTLVFSIDADRETEGGLDSFYGLLITSVVMMLFFFLVGMSLVDRMVNQMPFLW